MIIMPNSGITENGKAFECSLHDGKYFRFPDSDQFRRGCYGVTVTVDIELLPERDFVEFLRLLGMDFPGIKLKEQK